MYLFYHTLPAMLFTYSQCYSECLCCNLALSYRVQWTNCLKLSACAACTEIASWAENLNILQKIHVEETSKRTKPKKLWLIFSIHAFFQHRRITAQINVSTTEPVPVDSSLTADWLYLAVAKTSAQSIS